MRRQIIATASVGALAAGLAAAVSLSGGAAGATVVTSYFAYSGGSQIRALGGRVTSDLSVQSAVSGTTKNASDAKNTVGVTAGGVLTAGVVSTTASLSSVAGGRAVTSTAKTAGISLLNGLITADAVTTTSTSSIINGTYSSSAHTDFANLHIAGVKVPVNVPPNYGVTIPGVATVILNMSLGGTQGQNTISIGAGLGVTLLKAAGQNATGAEIYLSPTFSSASTADSPDTGHKIAGSAYGTKINAAVGSTVQVSSDQTAPVSVPAPGTDGAERSRSVLSVHLAPIANVGAIETTYQGTNTEALADAATTSKVANVSLLNGLIKVGAVTSSAHATFPTGGSINLAGDTKIVSLTIAGKTIPVGVAPNTTISLGALGSVIINEQVRTSNTIAVAALDVKISTAAYGLAAGSQITVAVASASVA